MNGRPLVKKNAVAAAGCAIFFSVFLCSKNLDKGTNPPEYPAPVITLSQPANGDTTVPEAASSLRISGTIGVAEGLSIQAFSINTINFIDSISSAKNKFAVTLPIALDTNRFVLKVTDNKNKSALDTVRVVRLKAVIPATKSVLTGTMYRPGTGPSARRLAEPAIASNAGGRSMQVSSVIPLSGADILLYKSDSLTTASFASTKTDTAGQWKVTVDPGSYFIFAVWFDQQNLELITAAIQNAKAEPGKADTTEDKIALVDDVPPMVLSFLDAQTTDDKNNFLASNLPRGLPIIITFSEPMNRLSAGEDTSGIVLGEIDPSDANLALISKIPLEKVWGATGKELRLMPRTALTIGRYYKVVIPSTVKDLALNKIGSNYYGIFSVVALADAVPFKVKGATIQNGDTIAAEKVIEIAFSRPIDGISLNKQYSLTPALNSFFEAKGNLARLSFPMDSGLAPSTAYTLKIARATKDLLGDSLPDDYTLSFRTKAALDPSAVQGVKAKLVAFVSQTMEAFIAQDIERFGQSFHPLLEAIDIMTDAQGKEQVAKLTYEAFLKARKNDAALRKRMAIEGVFFPRIYRKVAGTDTIPFRKLIGKTGVGTAPAGVAIFIEDVGPGGFKQPRILDSNGVNISTQVTFKGDTIVALNHAFIANIPFNLAFFSSDQEQRDPYYFGQLQKEKTNIEMQVVTIISRDTYTIRSIDTSAWAASPSSADVLFDLVTTEQMSNNPKAAARAMAIKMVVVGENGRLLVKTIVAKSLFEGTKDQFAANQNNILNQQNFNPDSFKVAATKPIELFAPAQKAVSVSVPVVFKWSKVAGVKSYLLGISNEMSGGANGLLIFAKDTTVGIGAKGEVTGGTVLTMDPSQIKVPLPRFASRIGEFDATSVYGWKVVGLADSTSANLTGQLMVIADSDFRPSHQWGCFTLAAVMPDLSKVGDNQQAGSGTASGNDFADSDKDGCPDWMEKALGTNAFDAAGRPEMLIDSDKDGIADFFEIAFTTKPEDPASKPADANGNHIPDALEGKPSWDPRLTKDSDKDGWPDEIEMMLTTDPWNANSAPQVLAKGAAPVGNYRGKLLIQADNKEFTVAISVYADSTGASKAVIDSTSLDILRPGEMVDLRFVYGEWVFYYKMVAGMNANKYLKFRCVPKYQELEGAIDMSDQANGGGPYVGRFRVRTDGNVESLLGGGGGPNPGTQPGAITAPPQDFLTMLTNPPADAKTLSITVSKDAAGKFSAALTLAGASPVSSIEAMWQPQMFPMYIFRFKGDSGEIRVEGAIFKDAAGLYLGGPVFINMKQTYNFAVKNPAAKVDDPTPGTWTGYAMKTNFTGSDPNTQGLLAYIGPREALVTALNSTKNNAMRLFDSLSVTIKEFWQEGVWKCKDSTGNVYQILEKPGDPQNVFVGKDKSGNEAVMVRPDGTQPNTNQGSAPYTGPVEAIKNALAASGNSVKVMVPNNPTPADAQVDITTLGQMPDPKAPSSMIYKIADKNNPAKTFIFMADPQGGKLAMMDGKPLVSDMGGGSPSQGKPIPFTGPIDNVKTALSGSGNTVKVMTPNSTTPHDVQVNPATLQPFTDPQNPGATMYRVKDNMDTMKQYLFMADSATKQLLMMDKKPLVSEMGGQSQTMPPPFRGTVQAVEAALNSSNDGVLVINPQNGPKITATVNRSSLQSIADPKAQGQTLIVAARTDDPSKKVVFLGNPGDPMKLNVEPGSQRPLVTDLQYRSR